MINRNLFQVITLSTVFLLFSLNVSAAENSVDDKGWFTGIFAGYAQTKVEINSIDTEDSNTESYGPYVGYNFAKWFGLELQYMATNDLDDNKAGADHANFSSIILTPKFSYRFNERNSMFFKTGVAWLVYTEKYDFFYSHVRYSWRGGIIPITLGMQFDIVKGLKARISYDRISGILYADKHYSGRSSSMEVELNQVLAGLHYQF